MKKSSYLTPILLSPGPVPMLDIVKEKLGLDMTHHRSQEICEDLKWALTYLKKIFQTQENVYVLNASGTGAMEASLTNTLSPQDEILCICSGKFGERWAQMARTFQIVVHELQVPWGEAVQTSEIEKKLSQNSKIKAVLVQACETSTGVLHPMKEIGNLIHKKKEIILVVDGISALIANPLPMDEWHLDVLVGGSQKSFSLPAGMSFISLSQKAQKFQDRSQLPAFYFDLNKEKKANEELQTSFSSNVSFIRALRVALEYFNQVGVLKIRKKSEALKKATEIFCNHLNLSLFSKSPSASLTAVCIPQGINGSSVKKAMEKKGVVVGGGQDHLKGQIVRFGHLGAISIMDYIQGLKVFGEALREQRENLFTEKELSQSLQKVKDFFDSQNLN